MRPDLCSNCADNLPAGCCLRAQCDELQRAYDSALADVMAIPSVVDLERGGEWEDIEKDAVDARNGKNECFAGVRYALALSDIRKLCSGASPATGGEGGEP